MKNLKKISVLLFLSILISCGGNDDDLGLSGEGSLTAKVDGTAFESLKATVGAVITDKVAAIQGSKSDGEYIRINIMNYTGVGTYKTGDAINNTNIISYGTVSPIASWVSTFNIGTGTIKITEDTATRISDTFSFTGVNDDKGSKTITEGKFSATKK